MDYSADPTFRWFASAPHNMAQPSPGFASERVETGYAPAAAEYDYNVTFPPSAELLSPATTLSELSDFIGLKSAAVGNFGSVPFGSAMSYDFVTSNLPAPVSTAPDVYDTPVYYGNNVLPVPYNPKPISYAPEPVSYIPPVSFQGPDFSGLPDVNRAGQFATPVRDYWSTSLPYDATHIIPPASEPTPLEFPGLCEPDEATCVRPSWLLSDGEEDGWCTQEELRNLCNGPAQCVSEDYSGGSLVHPALPGGSPGAEWQEQLQGAPLAVSGHCERPALQGAQPRKRPREDLAFQNEHVLGNVDYEERRLKKAKGAVVTVPAAGGSGGRANQTPSARTLTNIDRKSESAGSGAGGLAVTAMQGVSRQSSSGPEGSRGLAGTCAGKAPARVERGEKVPEEAGPDGEDKEVDKMPKRLSKRHLALLDAPQEQISRGKVEVMRCRLCPKESFKKWRNYKRHCNGSEAHPIAVYDCEQCGECYGRKDALKRHADSCNTVRTLETMEKAETGFRVFEKCKKDFARWMKTGEPIEGGGWAERMKVAVPNSSKWRT